MFVESIKYMLMAQDMNRAIRFYRDVVGLEVKFESPQWTELALGNAIVALHGGGTGAYRKTGLSVQVRDIVYLENLHALKAKKVDEIWCVAVNDAFVMAHWGRDQKAMGKIRFLADGSALWTRALGLEVDRTAAGMGIRMQRFSMLLDDGVVRRLNVEAPGKFEVSDAQTLLKQLA